MVITTYVTTMFWAHM